MTDLHPSHRWADRWYQDGDEKFTASVCLACEVEGFDDEPTAFTQCPKQRTPCPAWMESLDDPGHRHECIGGHTKGDHKCVDPECRKWFGPR